jgi:hypothetical protein
MFFSIIMSCFSRSRSMSNLNHLQNIYTNFKSITTNLVNLPWLTKSLVNFVPSIFITSLLSTLFLKPCFFVNCMVCASWWLWRLVANYVTKNISSSNSRNYFFTLQLFSCRKVIGHAFSSLINSQVTYATYYLRSLWEHTYFI